MAQFTVPCAVYRGGTSRGLFFNKRDLPEDVHVQRKIFLEGIDAYNPSQVNGLGSGTSHTSKVCVISEPSVEGADVDYTFYQIGIGEELVDDQGTCGNLMAAVAAFAVDEGYVAVEQDAEYVEVHVFNTNIKKMLRIDVPVIAGKARVTGDYLMPGIVKPGAKFSVNILNPGGGKTGSTLPKGKRLTISTEKRSYELSFVDLVNPFVFVAASDLGIKGTELNSELSLDEGLMEELQAIRLQAAVEVGMYPSVEVAQQTPSIPKIALISPPQDYVTSTGEQIKAEDVDVVAKMLSMGKFHRTFAASGLYCTAAATLLPGTIPNQLARELAGTKAQKIRIGHPEGIAEVYVTLTENGQDVHAVGLDRTARRIMKGDLFIPEL